ncbi:MAG: metallophosphoesterase [Actinobacteria bacterium]|nr:metallophosphoesterase [Actinomycetota bacterium]
MQEISAGMIKPALNRVNEEADMLILTGDLTQHGRLGEAAVLLRELSTVDVPIVAVLGNHDFHDGNEGNFAMLLAGYGVIILDGGAIELSINGLTVGLTGTKGFGGGFGMRTIPDFGEQIFKNMYREASFEAAKIGEGLESLETDFKVVVLHYSPVRETLQGEPLEIYPFLGTSILAEPIDRYGADLVIHGHAHHGSEISRTAGGIPVRNVAMPLLGRPYRIYHLAVPTSAPEIYAPRR